MNRLEDSVILWKNLCSNTLLAKVDLVVFLNKCDILASKLASGIRLTKYVRSFGERPNDAETAEKCALLFLMFCCSRSLIAILQILRASSTQFIENTRQYHASSMAFALPSL